jgi:hypothetical protein
LLLYPPGKKDAMTTCDRLENTIERVPQPLNLSLACAKLEKIAPGRAFSRENNDRDPE